MSSPKKHKKLIIILIIIFIVAIVVIVLIYNGKKKKAEALAQVDELETETISKQTISNYVSMTGTIKAKESQTVYSTVNEVEVLAVNVKVGDYVNAGDVIAVLDSSDFENQLARAKRDLENQQLKNAQSLAKAERNYVRAFEDALVDAEKMEKGIIEASTDYGYTEGDKDDAYQDWQDALEDYREAEDDYNEAKKKYKKLKKNKESVKYDGETYYYDSTGTTDGAKTKSDLKKTVESLESAKDSAEKKATEAQRSYEHATQSLEKSYRSYDSAEVTKEDKIRSDARAIQDAQNSLYDEQLSVANSTSSQEDKIEDVKKSIEKCTIKAPISGVVTSVKMEAGNETANDKNEICVINDTSMYLVEGTVDEYSVASVKEGLKAIIKTEADSEAVMNGVVTFVSPTPEDNSTNYKVKVKLDSLYENARIGMTADTNILIQTAENALAVPYTCITQNLDNEFVIYAVDDSKVTLAEEDKGKKGFKDPGNGEKDGGEEAEEGMFSFSFGEDLDSVDISRVREMGREIVIEKLAEGDYYTAISGEGLSEGMEVYVVTTASEDSDEDGERGGPGGGPEPR